VRATFDVSNVSALQTAVEGFREAALLPQFWPEALNVVAESFNSNGATLVLTPTRAPLVAFSAGIETVMRQQYFALPFPDPREHRVSPNMGEGFKGDHAYFSSQEIARDPFYQEFLIPRGFGWHAAAALGAGLLLSLKRDLKRGRYEEAELAALNQALPGLRAASRVAGMTWRSTLSSQLSLLERIDRGAILIDVQGRVMQVNDRVKFGDGLDVVGGALHAPASSDRQRLQKFLAAAIDPAIQSAGGANTLILPRPSCRRPWVLDAIACTDALRSLHSRAAALVLITDIERPAHASQSLLREMFGLTLAEAKLARHMMIGHSLARAAETLGISEGHARQRLKSIFRKTDTSGQVELIALLTKLN
jgi:DNA-binding CsgD family transcriptional regulator